MPSLSGVKLSIFCFPLSLLELVFRHFATSWFEFVIGLTMSLASSPISVLCIGHSHIYWLSSFVEPADLFAGFEVQDRPCNVQYLGRRGATLDTFLEPSMMARIASYRADVIVLHLGGNTLDGKSFPNPIMVALDIQRLASRLLDTGVRRIVVSQVCRRQKWRNSTVEVGAERVVQVNQYIDMFCSETEGMFFWRHKRMWNSVRPIFRRDGVHFSDVGNYRFYRSIRGAIISAVGAIVG